MKILKKKKKHHNQGNTYIMVVATLSFLAVLVAAMLVAVALCYRLKAYDINARDNFYYLEQAMDEIYAGVGADAMRHLNTAYDDTLEVLVYYDTKKQSYITMKDEEANVILKNTFMNLVQTDPNYADVTTVENHLKSFLSNPYSASKPEGIMLAIENVNKGSTDRLDITNLVLKREAKYSTINTRKKADGTVAAGDTFVQTITTDLVIGKPEFNVNFNTIDSNLSALYDFAFVADQGIEIGNATTDVTITGNIYAASDFYNKKYNDSTDTDVDSEYAKVTSYDASDSRFANSNGKNEKSMYSGLYINGADVFISADKMIVPGSIAAMNSATLTVFGTGKSVDARTDIWADGIVLGGYSFLVDADDASKGLQGASMDIRANAYVYDDLEINADSSEFTMSGGYYGYNYASTDNRTYTDTCLMAHGQRTFVSKVDPQLADATNVNGQAHYNSSAIIVNGQNSIVDLSNISDMYIAGQSYIETSKSKKESKKELSADGSETANNYIVTNKNNEDENVTFTQVDYRETEVDADGDKDYYTTNSSDVANKKDTTDLQDYRTGEAISIKSNQLAYRLIPSWAITDNGDELYLDLSNLANTEAGKFFKKYFKEISKIPVVKSYVSGKAYYFFDFSTADTEDLIDKDVMNTFIAEYAELFKVDETTGSSSGYEAGLMDITDYDQFKIKMLTFDRTTDTGAPDGKPVGTGETAYNTTTDGKFIGYNKIHSNSAITVKYGNSFTIKAKSSNVAPLKNAANKLNEYYNEQNELTATDAGANVIKDVASYTDDTAATLATKLTTELQNKYQELKWTLTDKSRDAEAVSDSHTMQEADITPINYYFKFNRITDSYSAKLDSGYKVWVSNGDVEVTTDGFTDGNVKGLVICKGDVTFNKSVKSFEGLIVSGSKVKITHTMNFNSNEEIIKTILRECDESQKHKGTTKDYFKVCQLFRHYQSFYEESTNSGDAKTESAKSITAVQYEDVLSFNNWKKNVD
ncbi:MAG: hypothetical protein J6C01_11220 [Lachnospiraceae bacterium]|nr:hypothetical protein [Lachnospiraceae bacterium]